MNNTVYTSKYYNNMSKTKSPVQILKVIIQTNVTLALKLQKEKNQFQLNPIKYCS